MKRLMYICLLLLAGFRVPAQNKVIVESIRSFSMFGPSMHYLEDTSVRSSINAKLSVLLNNNFNLELFQSSPPIEIYTSSDALKNNAAKFSGFQIQVLGIYLWRFMNMIQSVFYQGL